MVINIRFCHYYSLICSALSTDYFVLWDKKIMHQLLHGKHKLAKKARHVLQDLSRPVDKSSAVDKKTKGSNERDAKWLSKVQDKVL